MNERTKGEKKAEQITEKFVPLYDARFYGEAAQTIEGTRVEILGRWLSDGSEAGPNSRYSQIAIRIVGDLAKLQLIMEEVRNREITANLDKIPNDYPQEVVD